MGVSRRHFLALGLGGLVPPLAIRPAEAGCGDASGTLTIRKKSDVVSFDPADCRVEDAPILRAIYGALVRAKPGAKSGEQTWTEHSAVAIRWSDGKRLEFKLRGGMKWTRGSGVVQASDVAYSFERVAGSKLGALHRLRWNDLDRLEVKDSESGVVHLKQPNDAFLSSCLLHVSGCIVPRDAVEATEKGRIGPAPTPAAVSGRYVVDRWDREDRIVLSCNDEWTGASPKYKTVKFVIIPDDRVAQDKVDSKEIDLMRAEPDTLNQMSPSRLAPLQVVSLPGLTISYLALDVVDDRFKDARLRNAVRLALNVDTAVKLAYGAFARRATGLVPSTVDGALREVSAGRDPRGAKRLLSEAGFRGGFTTSLFVFPRSLGTEIMADSFVRDLAEIGVKLDVKFESPVEARRARQPVPISLVRRTMVPDPRVVLGSFGSADNAARFESDAARALVRALASATGSELVKTSQALQDLLNKTSVTIPLAEESAVWLLQRGLQVPFTRFGELPDLGDIPLLRR